MAVNYSLRCVYFYPPKVTEETAFFTALARDMSGTCACVHRGSAAP